jgi:DNA polymerase III delta subunit
LAKSKLNLTYLDFEKQVSSGRIQPVYYVIASDNYFVKKAGELLREKISGSKDNKDNFFLKYADEVSVNEIIDLCNNFSSLFSANKIVIVKHCEKFGKKFDEIVQYAQNPDKDTTLLLAFDKEYVIDRKLDREFTFYDFANLPDELYLEWVKSIFESKGCIIASSELNLFVESVPRIFELVENEISKIAGYCDEVSTNGGKKITKDIIYKFIGYDTTYSPGELMSSILERDSRKSLEILDNMIAKGGINEFYLLNLITSYYMDLMSAKTRGFDSAGMSEIYGRFRIWSDRIGFVKNYKNRINEEDFGIIFDKLLKTDQQLKTSMLDSKVLLTSLVEELANI